MIDNVNLLKMPDEIMRSLGRRYRGLCRWQRKFGGRADKLVRGHRIVTFEQFVQDQNAAEMIHIYRASGRCV